MSTKEKTIQEQAENVVTEPKGMTKTVTVYVVKSELASVNFPSKSRARAAQELLTFFSVPATIETVKKKIDI